MAKHGPSFESMLLEAEANNSKFGFLKRNDIYRPYYEQKIKEFSEEGIQSDTNIASSVNGTSQVLFEQPAQIQSMPPRKPVRQPPPDQYSVPHPYISMADR